jgi:hypothetical protein
MATVLSADSSSWNGGFILFSNNMEAEILIDVLDLLHVGLEGCSGAPPK